MDALSPGQLLLIITGLPIVIASLLAWFTHRGEATLGSAETEETETRPSATPDSEEEAMTGFAERRRGRSQVQPPWPTSG